MLWLSSTVLVQEFNSLSGLKNCKKKPCYCSPCSVPLHQLVQSPPRYWGHPQVPVILHNLNYHSMRREKIQWANWFFWWPHEHFVLHLTECWIPSHAFLCGLKAWSSTEVPLPTWEPCCLHHTGSLHGFLFQSGGSWGSVMLSGYHGGAAIDLHEQSPAQQLTISQKNVVDYSCTE